MFLVLLDIILLLIIIQFAYIKIAFEMYGQYHLPRGKNPALSCLIGFVSMDRAKQQSYNTIYITSDSSLGRRVVYSSVIRVERSLS